MPHRVVVTAPQFGAWLRKQRGSRSLEQIARQIRGLVKATGLKVNPSLIFRLEEGRVPSWPLLAAMARVYNVPYRDIVLKLSTEINFPGYDGLIGRNVDIQLSGVRVPGEVEHVSPPVPTDFPDSIDAAAKELAVQAAEWVDRLTEFANIARGHAPNPGKGTPELAPNPRGHRKQDARATRRRTGKKAG